MQRLHKEHGVKRLVAAANGDLPSLTAAPVGEAEAGDAPDRQPVLPADARTRLRAVLADLEATKDRIDTLLDDGGN